ncbi:MAG: hypothetical protein JNL40_16185 [Cyclobacteriaceae bacterium]|nr:hypothetical protein [Cyclobacteriaceae bacterium]
MHSRTASPLKWHLLRLVLLVAPFATPVLGQQNLFNVPSSDITVKNKLFFQQQINLLNDGTAALNSTLCYGLGKGFEAGVNILGVYIDPHASGSPIQTNSDAGQPPLYPFFTVNLQKGLVINPTFKLGLGTQIGFSPGMHFGNFTYLNLVTAIPRLQAKIVTGINHGSESFLGPGDLNPYFSSKYDPVGFQFGLEQEIIHGKLLILAEHISGTHTLGISVLGLGYHVSDHWVLSTGYQFSSAGNQTPNSIVLELTFVPSAVITERIYHEGHSERK